MRCCTQLLLLLLLLLLLRKVLFWALLDSSHGLLPPGLPGEPREHVERLRM